MRVSKVTPHWVEVSTDFSTELHSFFSHFNPQEPTENIQTLEKATLKATLAESCPKAHGVEAGHAANVAMPWPVPESSIFCGTIWEHFLRTCWNQSISPCFHRERHVLCFFPRKIQQKRRETSLSRWRRLLRAWGKRSRSWPEFFWRKVKSVNIWVIGSQEALNHQKVSMLFKLQKHLKVCKKSTSQSNLHTAPFQDSPFRPARFFSTPLIKCMLQSCSSSLSASSTSVFCYPKWWSGSATTLWIYLSCWTRSLIWKASIFFGGEIE